MISVFDPYMRVIMCVIGLWKSFSSNLVLDTDHEQRKSKSNTGLPDLKSGQIID